MHSKRFIAHIRKVDKREQYVDEHNDHVADLAAAVAHQYGVAKMAKLAGRHHDDGKNTPEFAAYIQAAAEGKRVVRGSVIHSTHGAILVNELVSSKDLYSKLTGEIIRTVIMSHHGLRDCLTLDGDAVFAEAAEKVSDSYEGIKDVIYQHYGADFINNEFIGACRDARSIAEKIRFLQDKSEFLGSQHFYLSMFTRLLTSIVIDADRTDTACFEDNTSLPQIKTPSERKEMWENYLKYYESRLEELQRKKNHPVWIHTERKYQGPAQNLMRVRAEFFGWWCPAALEKP